ncbi:hypothetical protein [Actinomadura sp. HBU206391]|uniref:hypothetical protein n=1 Tax=Actinomadura sp. HBU206391 TaxID=2731692 RepID=UPI00164F9449|nr:hypothetical protein [Actinomadura sp. HBU206391]MBC6458047.1 hypothetical protein [Actinomadura sp. HBU206391]
MTRREWDALPDGVRRAVEDRCGPVNKAETPAWGCSSDFSATLHVENGQVFCKGIQATAPGAWMHRREAEVNPHLPQLAPRLLWQLEADGWLMLGFEHAPGRHPDLSPYSADLTPVAEAVTALRPALTPCPIQGRSLAARWAQLPVWQNYADDPPADLEPWAVEHLPHLVELEASRSSTCRTSSNWRRQRPSWSTATRCSTPTSSPGTSSPTTARSGSSTGHGRRGARRGWTRRSS